MYFKQVETHKKDRVLQTLTNETTSELIHLARSSIAVRNWTFHNHITIQQQQARDQCVTIIGLLEP